MLEKEKLVQKDLSSWMLKIDFNASSLLSSLHNLYPSWFSVWFWPKHHIQRHTKVESLVSKCLPIPQKICNITNRLRTPDEVEKYFLGFISFIDFTEQQIRKPVVERKRKAYYSGKKKKHTIKPQIMVNKNGIIIHKTGYKKGRRRHDYDIYKKNHSVTPKEVVNFLIRDI